MNAVGIIRVSRVQGREGDSFASPHDQRKRIQDTCTANGWNLVEIHEELDISGGKTLAKRPGLNAAVQRIEHERGGVVVGAYFDRLFRSLQTQQAVVERIEHAGGQVYAVDMGRVTEGTAGQWLSSTMIGTMSEYYRRSIGEKSDAGRQRAIERGVAIMEKIPPGYLKGSDGRLKPDPDTAPVLAEAFALRASGATVASVQAHLAAHDIVRNHVTVRELLRNRVYLGELRHGKFENLAAHPAIVELHVWQKAQRVSVSPGRRSTRPPRLLAKLGVLRCGSCGRAMVVQYNRGEARYRCGAANRIECSCRVGIGATAVEDLIVARVKAYNATGSASADDMAQRAKQDSDAAQKALDDAVAAFTAAGLLTEPSVIHQLAQLRQDRDQALQVADATDLGPAVRQASLDDFDNLDFDVQQGLVRAIIESAVVNAGKGLDRVSITAREIAL